MASLRTVASLLLGAVLYYAVVVYVGGFLAAVTVPRLYFEYFGHENVSAALAVLLFGTWSLPIMLLIACGTLVGLRLIGGSWRATSLAMFVGTFACFLYWQLVSALFLANVGQVSFPSAFVRTFATPWFEMPNLLAAWVGLGEGVWLYTSRFQRSQRAVA
jgi:hypothetical protein